MYEDIPHLMTPVVVDPKKAANALALGGARDGRALQDARGVRRPQHRAVQPQHAADDREQGDARGRRAAAAAGVHRRRRGRARRPDDGGRQRGRGVDRAAGANGARRRHSPDSRDAAPVGGRHHRPDQGQPAVAHLVPRVVEDRLAHDSRRQRRRAAAGQGRHAVSPAGVVTEAAAARPVHLRAGIGAAGELPAQAGQAGVRRDDHGRGQEEGPRPSSSRRTISTTRRRGSSSRAVRCRSRICSARCGSGSAGPRGWST